MATLCRMVVDTRYEDLPGDVSHQAKRSILDTLAVTIGGSAMAGIRPVVELVKRRGGAPESHIPFYGGKVPAAEAGLAIGPMARAMDLGDIHERSGHCSEYVFPALLAAAGLKSTVTGKELITAFVVGKEMSVRVGSAWNVPVSFSLGQGEGHGTFAATAAVGKLLGLNQVEMENAQGIARGLTQPHDLAMYNPATTMVSVHHGFVCQAAINACLLAQQGITGPRQEVLLGKRGFLAMARWKTEPDALLDRLGNHWEMTNATLKWHSCCGAIHTSIDALLSQMTEHCFAADDIAAIHVDASPSGWEISNPREMKWNPQTVGECQFSIPYVLATAAHDRSIFLDSYTPEARSREGVRALMTKVTVSKESGFPTPLAARVHTKLLDGRTFVTENHYLKGHPKNPLTDDDIVEKFRKCVPYAAIEIDRSTTDSLVGSILDLENIGDITASLIQPLVP